MCLLTTLCAQSKSAYWISWNVGSDLIVLLIIFMERKYGAVKGPSKGPLHLTKSSSYWLEIKATLHIRTRGLNSNTWTNESLQVKTGKWILHLLGLADKCRYHPVEDTQYLVMIWEKNGQEMV